MEARRVLSWIADLDADGSLDVVTGSAWYENFDARGNFIPHRLASPSALAMVATDVDDDSDLDLLRADGHWFDNRDGRGSFSNPQPLPNGMERFRAIWTSRTDPESFRDAFGSGLTEKDEVVGAGDLNGDGVVDLLLMELSRGVPRWFDTALGKVHQHVEPRRLGDINADGLFDSSDLVLAMKPGEYNDGIPDNSTFDEGDWNDDYEFDADDLILAFQTGTYLVESHPRLMMTNNDVPRIKQALERDVYAARFAAEVRTARQLLTKDYSLPTLYEHRKSLEAARIAFVALMLEPDDPQREVFAAKATEILLRIHEGTWAGTDINEDHRRDWDQGELHPWYIGNALMEYSLAYDWLMGFDAIPLPAQQDIRFRLLRLAQIENTIHATPVHELDRTTYYLRNANKRFRSLSGVGFVTLLFPEQRGVIYDPLERIPRDQQIPFNSRRTLDFVMGELFEQITIASPGNPTNDGMIEHFVSPDGYYEEGYTYQNDAFGITLPFLVAYHRNTGLDYISGNGPFDGRIARMFENNMRVMLPDETRPTIGDSWQWKGYEHHELVAPYTRDPDLHYWFFEEVIDSTTRFFGLSATGLRVSDAPLSPPDHRTEFLPNAGIAVFRDQWGPDATYLMLLAPNRPVRGHNQADQGSISLYANGAHLIIDPGYGTAYGRTPEVRTYVPGGKWNWLNSALAHSGITVDSVYHVDNTPAQELRAVVHPRTTIGSYTVAPDPAYLENMFAGRDIDYAEARVVYEAKDAELVRAVAFPRHDYFLIEDRISATGEHEYGWQLHLGPTDAGQFTGGEGTFQWTTANSAGQPVELGIVMLDGSRQVQHYLNGPTNYTGIVYPKDVFDHTYFIGTQTASDTRYLTLLDPHQASRTLEIETLLPGAAWKVIHSAESYDLIVSQRGTEIVRVGEIDTDASYLIASVDVVEGREVLRSVIVKGGSQLSIGYGRSETHLLEPGRPLHLEFR